ncbi:chorismate-binding protein [Polymorphospora sp. NPDC051019]|uniref:chorismate-binding protein n=1 Tax=Polymorphospora sp. NPDC051019 TaxID=3155725 RepID=UPI0034428E96
MIRGESTLRMRHIGPLGVGTLPVRPLASRTVTGTRLPALRERSRLEWRITDGGDPTRLLEDFLAHAGLPVRDLTAPPRTPGPDEPAGATVYLSAAAAAHAIGAPTGPASPVPAVPDLVAVVHEPATDPHPDRPTAAGGPTGGWWLGPWRESWTPAQHAAAVEQARTAIARGDIYQVNVVGHASADYTGDPLPALARLATLPGARYGGVLQGAGWAIGCASPETLVEVTAGRATTRPIKGTRPATATGRAELLASPKERAEHVMIVDLERNDLARVAKTGTVRVDELYGIRRWCDLWQAESVVSADLADGCGLAELLRAVCPGGSVTGAPKHAALAEIAAHEPVGRGASMGALGWIGPDGIDLGLTIRTAAVDADRVHVWAGGGITWGSDPDAEVAEAAAKAAPVRAALAGPAGARRPA